MEKRILIGGSGGQGILFMGKVIASAAMLDGKNVTWFPSYGAEMRCGTANCAVVISDEPIGSPVFSSADILVVFTEASLQKFTPRLNKDGYLLYDSSLITHDSSIHNGAIGINVTALARELGNTKAANMIMLGAAAAITGLLAKEDLFSAIESDMSECMLKALSINKRAILKGYEIVENQENSYFRHRVCT
ncbi:2-oxoacid:acceptor oxidoreductase family protein [Candidatus Magnetominusculus xianensis]|uniref:2-oxoacid:ferredoxin oxidoreductase subunit gamma n=1 Tax=Candidatus Magnetominusculus xianensis TaxID=1748249 RepID=A0ABR5SJW0_9BACT|nr:2-oxoacid:acceptor oxidoreductase family protein [Candidatus Magnetominusculus xianensis]KWT95125.1 2-oxoacid:ferredoxin oxidoreductase subunit gamma [Candidatus Magnetominusculus xianensis]MBF0402772.1 2-oxoacid:acceptor oxidoreductase family protein [Nitrospirota bacterium]